jgi:oxygen-independent coproporphyrinogen-3 oxidase
MVLNSSPGLYVHIPFCKSKCPYCGFYSIASTSHVSAWLDAFDKEVLLYKDRFARFDSLYLGGGTPSVLGLNDIERIMDSILSCFRFASDVEITIETNPGDMTDEKVAGMKALGFNRVNLGVQSFDDQDLRFLGRRHNADDAEKALHRLRVHGFENIGVDLIYGLPGQSSEKWRETLKRALRFGPEHISCYQLTIEKGTPFWRMRHKGMLNPLDEDEEGLLFITASELLEEKGYIHYEVSNFARGKAFYSRHNCKYWDHTPYLGLGPSAHSYQDSKRWWNVRSMRQYCQALRHGTAPVEEMEILTGEQMTIETIFLGLRTQKGFIIEDDIHRPNISRVISALKDSGLIRIVDNRIMATKEGYLVADRLPLYFI